MRSFTFYKGRVALYALLKAMGIGAGDEVLLQAYTCLAVPIPVLALGAKPVYVDIDPDSLNINPDNLENKITSQTKAIIVQHTFGVPAEMDKISQIAKKHNLYVIEDCCHSFESIYNGQKIGTIGDGAFYSFEWGKPIIVGTGGMAVVNNSKLIEPVKQLHENAIKPDWSETLKIEIQKIAHSILLWPSFFWILRDIFRLLGKLGFASETFQPMEIKGEMVHINKRLSQYHEQKLKKKLSQLEKDKVFRKKLSHLYEEKLNKPHQSNIVYLRYPFLTENKQEILQLARKQKIELGDWFVSPVHPLKENELLLAGYEQGSCPVAENVAERVVTLPMHRKITLKNLEKTISFLKSSAREVQSC